MKTAKKSILSILLACLVATVCLAFGVGDFSKAQAAATNVSVAGSALSISSFNSEHNSRLHIKVDGSDWASAGLSDSSIKTSAHAASLNTFSQITFDGAAAANYAAVDGYFNLWSAPEHSQSITINSSATEIVFAAGTELPSYAFASTGNGDVYVLSDTVKFTRTSSTSTEWTRTIIPNVTKNETSVNGSDLSVYETDNTNHFIYFKINGSDYASATGNTSLKNVSYVSALNTFDKATGLTGSSYATNDPYLALWGRNATIVFKFNSAATEIVFERGTEFPSTAFTQSGNGAVYVLFETVKFTRTDASSTTWEKTVVSNKINVSIDGSALSVYETGSHIWFQIEGSDYASAPGNTSIKDNINVAYLNTFEKVTGLTGSSYATNDPYFCLYTRPATIVFKIDSATEIVFAAGTELPSYAFTSTGIGDVYVLSEKVKFTRADSSATTWEKTIGDFTTVDVTDSIAITDESSSWNTSNNATWINISFGGKSVLPKDGGAAYYVNEAPTKNGVDLASYILINGVAARTAIAANANGTTNYKHASDFPMSAGGQYAPVLIRPEGTSVIVKVMAQYASIDGFTVTIKQGLEWLNNNDEKLVVQEDVTFEYVNGAWVDSSTITKADVADDISIEAKSGTNTPAVSISFGGLKLFPKDGGVGYWVNDNASKNGVDLASYIYVNGSSIRSIVAQNASSRQYAGTEGVDDFPLSMGAVYAPISVYCGETTIDVRVLTAYAAINDLTITVKSGLKWFNSDDVMLITTSDKVFKYENDVWTDISDRVAVAINDAEGNLIQTVYYEANSSIVLPNVAGQNQVLLGWEIGGSNYSPEYSYSVGTQSSTVVALVADFSMIDGAQVKLDGNSGLRFAYSLGKTSYAAYQELIKEIGIILRPTDIPVGTLTSENFTLEYLTVDTNVKKGVTNLDGNDLVDNGDYYSYGLRLINIYEKNYCVKYSARGYITIDFEDKQDYRVYTRYDSNNNSRSIMDVSKAALEDETATWTDAQKAILQNYVTKGQQYMPSNRVINAVATEQGIIDAYTSALALTDSELAGYTGDVVINLPSGTITLTQALSFSGSRAHSKNIRFVGNDTIISGGTQFKGGWTLDSGKVYKLNVGTGFGGIRQLYVDGKAAVLARSAQTTGTWDTSNKKLVVSQSAFSGITLSGSMEVSTLERWAQSYAVISSISTSGSSYKFGFNAASEGFYFNGHRGYADSTTTLFFLNNKAFLDEANEFFYDQSTGYLYYIPEDESTINDSEFVLPTVDVLLDTTGLVENVSFEGITFAYSNWSAPSGKGYFAQQAGVHGNPDDLTNYGWTNPNGSIKVVTSGVTFDGCVFRGMGAYAIGVTGGVSDVSITSNKFEYLSGGAIYVGEWNVSQSGSVPSNVTIYNNLVSDYGGQYGGDAGITVYYATNVNISRNTVQNGVWSAISVGWGWTSNDANTALGGFTINNNRIINSMGGELYDGGGIYLLGNSAACVNTIENNYVEASKGYGGIYLDEGASYYTIKNNAISIANTSKRKGCVFIHNDVSSAGVGIKNVTVTANYANYATVKHQYLVNGSEKFTGKSSYETSNSIEYSNASKATELTTINNIYANSGSTAA